jgi:hypothetical protein
VHGDAFEFVRTFAHDARNALSPKNPQGQIVNDALKRNQFGGTLGGPVIKNKLFVFGGIQLTRTRQSPPPAAPEFVPAAQELTGDFTTEPSTACQKTAVTLRGPFSGNTTGPANFSPPALKITNVVLRQLSKLGITADQCGQVTYKSPVMENEYQAVGRGDIHLSDKSSVFLRYIATSDNLVPPNSIVPLVLTTVNGGHQNLAQSAAVGDTLLFDPTVVNLARLAFDRTAIHRIRQPFFDYSDVGIAASPTYRKSSR